MTKLPEIVKCKICGKEEFDNKRISEFTYSKLIINFDNILICKDCLYSLLKRRHNKNGVIKSGLFLIKEGSNDEFRIL